MMQISKDNSLSIGDLTYIEKYSAFLFDKLLTIIEDAGEAFCKMSVAAASRFAVWTSCHSILK